MVTVVMVMAMVMIVIVIVMVIVIVAVMMPRRTAANRCDEHRGPDRGDENAARDTEPAQHDFARQPGRRGEQQAEDEDPARVGERHGRADDDCIARTTVPAGEVSRHHGLAVPGKRRVAGTERERENHPEHADQRGEAIADQSLERPIRTRDPAAHRISPVHMRLGPECRRPVAGLDA